MTERRWHDIEPADATDIDLSTDLTITAPLNEAGERCPWPWEPQQLAGAPMGQYHCPYCGAMVMAGLRHIDYAWRWRDIAPFDLPHAAALLKDGFTPDSVIAALTGGDMALLARTDRNDQRVLFVDDAEELRATLDQLAALYADDPEPFKVYRVNGNERIQFRYGVTVFVKRRR